MVTTSPEQTTPCSAAARKSMVRLPDHWSVLVASRLLGCLLAADARHRGVRGHCRLLGTRRLESRIGAAGSFRYDLPKDRGKNRRRVREMRHRVLLDRRPQPPSRRGPRDDAPRIDDRRDPRRIGFDTSATRWSDFEAIPVHDSRASRNVHRSRSAMPGEDPNDYRFFATFIRE